MFTPKMLSDLIGDIYDTVLSPALWPSVLERACVFMEATSANIIWQDAVDPTAMTFHNHGVDPQYLASYETEYLHINPIFPAAVFIDPGTIFTAGDVVPHDELRQTRFYREWIAPQGVADFIGMNIIRYPTSCAGFSFQMGTDYGIADIETRQRMALIAPHIQRAVLIGQHIRVVDGRVSSYEAVLDAHGAAVFLIGESGQMRFANRVGQAMLDEGSVVVERHGVLTARNARAARIIRDVGLGIVAPEEERNTISIALTDAMPRWLADVLPLRSGSRLAFGREQNATAAIFVRRAEIPAASGIEIMAQLYKLRASEVRVLQAIATGGGSVDDLAAALGISSATVKTHINALFAKTGTSRRDELVREVAAHGGALG
ncbi:DNA-binding transcriptional regulator, CsgD family [Beijerinckiaceae bacterium RH AL1]|nr:helix-turn-helix transcriptional regulator [Beijerinckiaceae bacterium]VVB48519.1 DNA-binding transcriptional regulator, CsgD family [Beijerinckiaceae bacterium RH CH11]VVB48600.1 DNA-binding transcriptional regulator, CsgD family [Beijerinckiaceae bacterium RH AL8]VVC56435.1 DNA-binding transcriptional regulator, CsgD family [Beijerinckiaceae bacterium RH AL1]